MPRIRPSRGTHITLARGLLPLNAGVIAPAGGGRTIFVLPWLGRILVGTTDNDYEGSLDHVAAADDDVTYLLAAVNAFFGLELAPGDLTGAYAGLRPLISTADARKSVDISRRAELYEGDSGLVTITGGKLTTWRRMAKLAVDRIVERDGRAAPCRTHEIPIGLPDDAEALPDVPGVEHDTRAHLAARYGHAARDVLSLAASAPQLAQRVSPELPDIAAEAAFAAGRQQALSLGDVLLRRTRLGVLDARRLSDSSAGAVGLVGRAMAGELGWDEARLERELHAWSDEARLEGLVPGGARAVAADRLEEAPLRAGAAPEEAA
jgi:glycerol-3-phosphate dehydrogenase